MISVKQSAHSHIAMGLSKIIVSGLELMALAGFIIVAIAVLK